MVAPRPASSTAPAPVPGSRILYGADYNPEQWDPQVWREDVELMRRAGVTTVSLGIWSWSALEPRPGEFDFGWFDEVMGLLTDAGIEIDLATPTAAPPAWFYRDHPEARIVEADGTVRHPGSRGICCPHSAAYAEAAERITTAIAEHVRDEPLVTMWHVHNEYGAPDGACHCETSQEAFRTWLQEKYGALQELNRAWGTAFWGQTYGRWTEIGTPRHSGTALNPTAELDFARFTSDSLLQRFIAERDVLRRITPGIPVTTNLMATNCLGLDYWAWAREMDVVSTDYYLEADSDRPQVWAAMESDLTRSLAGGRPWVLMEHSVSAVSWQPHNRAKDPGEERRTAFGHLARGADGILAFQWRQSRRGAEKFHSAMVPHAGADTRVFREVVELGAELGDLAPLRGSVVRTPVAILWDWESFWAQDLTWRPSDRMRHREQMRTVYEWLWRRGTVVDFVHPEHDLSRYTTLIAPASYLLSEAACTNLRAFVARGGTLAMLPFSAVVDEEECVHEGGPLSPLVDVLGVSVEEIRPVPLGQQIRLHRVGDDPASGAPTGTEGPGEETKASAPGAAPAGRIWSEHLRLRGATPVWDTPDGGLPGPVVTRHRHGDGEGVYVSTVLGVEDLETVLAPLLDLPTMRPEPGGEPREAVDGGPAGADRAVDAGDRSLLEAVTRVSPDGTRAWTVLVNHDRVPHRVRLEHTGDARPGEIEVAAGDVLVIPRG